MQALHRGELIVLPTETVYGLAADPRNPEAMARLYAAKGRSPDKAVTLMAAEQGQVAALGAEWDGRADKLARRFWPGPLTLVLRAPGGFTGFRIPDFAVAMEVVKAFGATLAVTSANRSGEPPALTAEQAVISLGESVAVVLDAGPAPGGVASTVVKIDGRKVEILRDGAIPARDIFDALE